MGGTKKLRISSLGENISWRFFFPKKTKIVFWGDTGYNAQIVFFKQASRFGILPYSKSFVLLCCKKELLLWSIGTFLWDRGTVFFGHLVIFRLMNGRGKE